MCHNNNNTTTRILSLSPNPSRKTRTKTRKPKFLSITREISPENTSNSGQMTHPHHHHQLNLFPLHPENFIEERDIHDENVSYFFDTDSNATLNGLLPSRSGVVSSDADSLSPSLTYTYGAQDSDEGAISLARTALRHQERDTSEEKWVCYSEVVEEKKEDEVTSGSADVWCFKQSQGLSLKLDYQEILNAWSDKGPLYIEGEGPQIVPDVLDDSSTVLGDGGSAGIGRLWRVPDDGNSMMSDVGGGDSWKIGQREASVLRYKEKRQSRLFAKRIRYEVRKLNAEKRPRMKGRFVKRS